MRQLLLPCFVALVGCGPSAVSDIASTAPDGVAPAASSAAASSAAVASPARLGLSATPKTALAELREASKARPVAVFKHSPICPISAAADERFRAWMGTEGAAANVQHAHIDVLAEKPLARGLVAELGVKHESPQVLLFKEGELVWHASHGAITGEALSEHLAELP